MRTTRLPDPSEYSLRTRLSMCGGEIFEYQLLIRTIDRKHLPRLCASLLATSEVVEFQLTSMAS